MQKITDPIMAKSPNRHNKIFMSVEPLENNVADMIRSGKLNELKDKKEVIKILRENGWDSDLARNVLKLDSRGNIMINGTKGVEYI